MIGNCGLEREGFRVMRASIKALLDNYQVRRTFKQKQGFTHWMQKHASEHGYRLDEQQYRKGRGGNLIVGNPKTAEIFLTAHYDTPSNALFPITTIVGNIPIYILSQAFIFFPIGAILWLLHMAVNVIFGDLGLWSEMMPFFWFEVSLLTLALLILWSFQMMMGFANRKNANDNTSGVAVLLSLLEDLPPNKRDKVCFVFFDDEEKGLVGSKFFRQVYYEETRFKPLINFDCVAHGKHLMFITRKAFRESKFNEILAEITATKALMKEAKKYVYPSDQLIFKNSVGVAALHKAPVMGYYLSRLHSRFDSKFDASNIETLNQMMVEFIERISDQSEK